MSLSPIIAAISTTSLAVLGVAAFIDVKHRLIPNRLVILTLGGGLLIRLLADPYRIWLSLIICFGIFVVLAYASRHNAIGGGDAKMIAATTLLVPPDRVISLLLEIALAGGIVAVVYLVVRFGLTRRQPALAYASQPQSRGTWLRSILRVEGARIAGGEPMPYGVAIAAGFAYCLLVEAVR
jgi:prepilin peptidase CpaA